MLDTLNKIVTEGHVLLIGIVVLVNLFIVAMVLKSSDGRWRWQSNEQPQETTSRKRPSARYRAPQDKCDRPKHGRHIIDIPEKKNTSSSKTKEVHK